MALAIGAPLAAAAADVQLAFVPMDDRPATELFPQQTAAICGAHLLLPPQPLLGHFTQAGDADAIGQWLSDLDTTSLRAVVVSADMLAYGGLIASRIAATPLATARARIAVLTRFHQAHPAIPIYVFGTVMRLAPTETPQTEPYLDALTSFARSAGAQAGTDEQTALAGWRAQIPDAAYWDYIGARARDLDIDEMLVRMAAVGDIAWLAVTQDDAGSPDGLQVSDRSALVNAANALDVRGRVFFGPGADEMGMVAVTRAIEDEARWHPQAEIAYSVATGRSAQDPLEDIPVGGTLEAAFRELGLREAGARPDIRLAVFAPSTSAQERSQFVARLAADMRAGTPVAIVDLSFIDDDIAQERAAFEALQAAQAAALPTSFASWNTTANSAGTALSAGVCAGVATHEGVDTALARTNFLFDRYVDDYAYRLLVRPGLNAQLRGDGFDTYALGAHAAQAQSQMRAQLWPLALDLFDATFAGQWDQRELSMYLPWQRTFEIQLNTTLASKR
ncbi:MAG TPA: DUF4127 family protein [Candidatus Binatus sp.]|nr:DUF4127 family protein [Candidatus Binatus sp.]